MIIDGKKIKLGDTVHFKSDVEQYGRVARIIDNSTLVLKSPSVEGFDGDYIGGQSKTTVHKSECWLE